MDETDLKLMDRARVAYEAYRAHSGGVSLISGLPIPQWEYLHSGIQEAWVAAASAVAAPLELAVSELRRANADLQEHVGELEDQK